VREYEPGIDPVTVKVCVSTDGMKTKLVGLATTLGSDAFTVTVSDWSTGTSK